MTINEIVYSEDSRRHLKLIKTINKKKVIEEISAPEPYFIVIPRDIDQAKKELLNLTYKFKDKDCKLKGVKQITKNYQNKNTEVLQAFVEFPTEIPIVRNLVKELDSVITVHETDIPYLFRVILDEKIKLYENYSPKILAFDIETECSGSFPDSKFDRILSISYYGKDLQKVTISANFNAKHDYIKHVANEKELLKDFQETINKYNPDIITGYNSDIFDMDFIKGRCKKLGINLELGLLKSKLFAGRGNRNSKKYKIDGLTHFDTYIFIRNILSPNLKTHSLTLDNVSEELLGERKLDPIGKFVSELWTEGTEENFNRIAEYNLQDSRLTYLLAEKTMPIALNFSKFTGLPIFDVSRMRYGRLVEQYIIKSAIEQNRVIENKPNESEISARMRTRYEGAFVVQPKPGVYKNIRVFDFRSLYPSILLAHNINEYTKSESGTDDEKVELPEKTIYFKKTPAFIPPLVENILKRRATVKSELKKHLKDSQEYRDLDAESYGLKILANSFYGYLGFYAARWYSLDSARSITALGRKYINDVMNIAKKHKIEVIYGDTDSVFLIDSKNIPAFVAEVNEHLPNPMELEDEGAYKSGVFLEKKGSETGAKKRYALLDQNDKLVIKGLESRRGDWSKLAQKTQLEILKIILSEGTGDSALKKIQDTISNIRKGKIPIQDLTLSNKLTRNLHEYKTRGPQVAAGELLSQTGINVGPGTIVKYVVTKGTSKRISDRVKLPETIDIGEIDHDYYIDKQLIGATYKILELFGYSEEQIKNLNTGLDNWL